MSATATTAAHAVALQSGPFWPGNLLSMDNADFENGVGDWQINSNVTTLTTGPTAFLHNDALKIVAAGGTSIIKLSGSSGIEIDLPGLGTTRMFRVGAYVKMPATSGHTTEFDLGCYDSSGTWIAWSNGSQVTSNSTGAWQWVEDDIVVPSNCAHVQGSPRVQFTGMTSGDAIHMDEVWFAPQRAALMIGAFAPTATAWSSDNTNGTSTYIGPLQSDKVFWTSNQDFGSWSGDSQNTCYAIEQQYQSDHSQWPVCLIAFKAAESESQIEGFLKDMPPDQTVIFIYHQEPEGDTDFAGTCGSTSGYDEFKCEFEQEVGNIRTAAATDGRTENVFTAENSASSKYDTPDSDDSSSDTVGYGCHWIVPSSYADFYIEDHYERGWADGSNLSLQSGMTDGDAAEQWNNWLNCVGTSGKPIGLAEYGLCSGSPDVNICGPNDSSCYSQDSSSTVQDKNTMVADNNYLGSGPSGTSPTLLWEYWYTNCWQFDDTNGGMTEWRAIENQNGGAVGG